MHCSPSLCVTLLCHESELRICRLPPTYKSCSHFVSESEEISLGIETTEVENGVRTPPSTDTFKNGASRPLAQIGDEPINSFLIHSLCLFGTFMGQTKGNP